MLLASLVVTAGSTFAQIALDGSRPMFGVDGKIVVMAPEEGLWSVAAGWQDDWMCDWRHADPQKVEVVGDWTVLSGKMSFAGGQLISGFGLRAMLIAGVVMAVAGTLVFFLTVEKNDT